ncbi:hypothetical protein [Microcoleus sp. herbarium14]|uniref:hypothetical protein n=1 Tax=Microcoleus sp. herbarium14 TaxID=3055439 RepID=UPI002FD19009
MKIKLNLLLLLFRTREHQLACTIASAGKQGADATRRADGGTASAAGGGCGR